MKPVYILYYRECPNEERLPEIQVPAEKSVRQVSEINKIDISLKLIPSKVQYLKKIAADPNYDFIFIHLGGIPEMGYELAQETRRFSENAIFVAESTMHPRGEKEVLQYFDEYTWGISNTFDLEAILKKYGYIPAEK